MGQVGHSSLLFVAGAAFLVTQEFTRGEPGRAIKPTCQHRALRKRPGLSSEGDKHGVRHFVGPVCIPHLPERNRVNHAEMTIDQFAECLLRTGLTIAAQQFEVIHVALTCT